MRNLLFLMASLIILIKDMKKTLKFKYLMDSTGYVLHHVLEKGFLFI